MLDHTPDEAMAALESGNAMPANSKPDQWGRSNVTSFKTLAEAQAFGARVKASRGLKS